MDSFKNSNHQILLEAAKKLKLEHKIISIDPPSLKLSSGKKSHTITQKSFGINSTNSINLSRNKAKTIKKLSQHHLPVPQQITVYSVKEYLSVCQSRFRNREICGIPFPQVIKPLTGQKGKFVFLNIKNINTGKLAVKAVLSHYPDGCLIETYIPGNDYRLLVLNSKVIGVAQRLAPTITGNGKLTIKKLVDVENNRRQQLYLSSGRRILNRMRNWPRLNWYLNLQRLSLQSILPQGKTITLYPLPNFSTGGSVKTIPLKSAPKALIDLAETAAKVIGLAICGIDIVGRTIIEVNSDPGLRLHDWPNQGKSQHVAETILTSIFKLNRH